MLFCCDNPHRSATRPRLHIEPLEPRLPLAGDTVLINFQLAGAPVPTRYEPDYGAVFGDRGNGLSYGWSSDHTDVARDRGLHPDQRLDTLIHFHEGQVWELTVPNGRYEVTVSIGDPEHPSRHTLSAEGIGFWTDVDMGPGDFRVSTQEIAVADGRLTLDQGALPDKGTRINYIHVVGLPAGTDAAPVPPTIREPAADLQRVHPADMQLEANGFDDPDGDNHLSSDWEIWTLGPLADRVWQALGTTGAERVSTRLVDGVFENSHAGRADLLPGTQYSVRVRFRDDAGSVSDWSTRRFVTEKSSSIDIPFAAQEPGFEIDVVADGFQLPTNIAFVPDPGPNPDDPLFYVTELYGTIKVVTNNFEVSEYATGLLNFNPTGDFPGSGEQGLAGIVVDPASGDVIVTRVTSRVAFDDTIPHHPQVVRFSSTDGGRTASITTVLLDMVGETQGQSHQISNITIGPDGKLYVHNGDGFTAQTAQNLNSYRGKILRMNLDGSAPSDNPFYDASDGVNARDYVFAYGVRNPFGGAWRASDGRHYEVENGPSIDRLARIDRGVNYGWDGSNSSMRTRALYTWDPAHAPVNIVFVQPETFQGSGFPLAKMDHAFVSESGPTYANGPQSRGKRIVEFEFDAAGNVVSGPTTLVEYVGTGQATVVGLAAGPDGLYFTDLYKDLDAASPIEPGARIYRVRFEPLAGDYNGNGTVEQADLDLVLLAWGQPAENSPPGWIHNLPSGAIDQAELDAVLLNWGATSDARSAAGAAVAARLAPRALQKATGKSKPLKVSFDDSPLSPALPAKSTYSSRPIESRNC
jgi:glucose/arabinose dehydrogenase